MSDGYILQMNNITKTFPGVKALSDVTLNVSEASIHAICGENGAGKSTLMKVLSGVYPYGSYDGEIVFQGKKMTFKNIKVQIQSSKIWASDSSSLLKSRRHCPKMLRCLFWMNRHRR